MTESIKSPDAAKTGTGANDGAGRHGFGAHSAPASRGPHGADCAPWGGSSRGVGRSPTLARFAARDENFELVSSSSRRTGQARPPERPAFAPEALRRVRRSFSGGGSGAYGVPASDGDPGPPPRGLCAVGWGGGAGGAKPPGLEDAIALDGVTKRYGQTVAVRELSISVRRGEMFGLIGPDGAGKTSTIRIICGLIAPDAGTVRVLGVDPVGEHRRLTDRVGYLSQRFSLYGDLSIDENIAFFAEIHGVREYHARRDRLLDLTQLTPFRARLADRLSGGMKQKLALACTLVHEPSLIVLDEPTTGVDPVSRREFWKLLSEFLSQGITIVMATPYLDEAERCSRVALLHQGGLLALDEPAALTASLPGTLVEVIVTEHRRAVALLREIPGVHDVQMFGERAHVRLDRDDDEAVDRLTDRLTRAGVTVASVRPIATSLEDVFIARLHEAAR